MPVTDYAALRILNRHFNGTVYSFPATWYVGFRHAGTELASTFNYSRISAPADLTTWPLIAGAIMSNGIDLVTPDSDGGDWEEADEVGLWDAATSGNLWFYDFLDFPFTQLDGNFHSFAPGEMRIKLI